MTERQRGPSGTVAAGTPTPTTGTHATRVLGGLTLASLAAVAVLGLAVTGEDEEFGQSVRLLYIHAPTAWAAYLAFGLTALGSALYLWKRTRSWAWHRVAGASAEVGVLFTGLCLMTGMVWGELTWGTWWVWDARLTSTSLMFIMFLGYLAIRRLDGAPEVVARRAAIAGLVAAIDIPLVHQSVEWWRGLHQDATVVRRDLDAQIDGLMLFTLLLSFVAFTLAFVWLTMHRNRVSMLEEIVERRRLDAAIAERHAEGVR